MSKQHPQAIHPSDANVVMIASKMPRAQESLLGCIYLYSGDTDSDFTHGYIYECVEGTSYVDIIGFDPARIGFDYTKGTLEAFFSEAAEDYSKIVGGTFEYLKAGDLWSISAVDKDGNTLFSEYKLYTPDLEDAGFVMLWPIYDYKDGEKIQFYFTHNKQINFEWVRVEP